MSIIGGANIHTFVFTDFKNNRFQKKLMMQNMVYEYSPLQLSTLATPLTGQEDYFVSCYDVFAELTRISNSSNDSQITFIVCVSVVNSGRLGEADDIPLHKGRLIDESIYAFYYFNPQQIATKKFIAF